MVAVEHIFLQRLCGVLIATDDLATIASRFAGAGHELVISVDGAGYPSIEDAVDAIVQDMEVELVTIATTAPPDRALGFTYRPHDIVLQTSSADARDRRAFLAVAELLASRPLSGSSLCDIVSALPTRPSQRPFLLATIGQLWKPTSASRPTPADARRPRPTADAAPSGRHPSPD